MPKSLKSIKDITPEILLKLVVHLLRALPSSTLPAEVPDTLPGMMHALPSAFESVMMGTLI
jgi:hypothetical protein